MKLIDYLQLETRQQMDYLKQKEVFTENDKIDLKGLKTQQRIRSFKDIEGLKNFLFHTWNLQSKSKTLDELKKEFSSPSDIFVEFDCGGIIYILGVLNLKGDDFNE